MGKWEPLNLGLGMLKYGLSKWNSIVLNLNPPFGISNHEVILPDIHKKRKISGANSFPLEFLLHQKSILSSDKCLLKTFCVLFFWGYRYSGEQTD